MLYEVITDRFDYAFREFIHQWAFKHPAPNDFFRMMNNATGEDLNWYWNEWYYQTWTLDQAVTSVNYVDNEPVITSYSIHYTKLYDQTFQEVG